MSENFAAARQKLAEGPTPYPLEDLPNDRNDDLWTEIRSEYGLTLPELAALKNTLPTETPRKKQKTGITIGSPTPARISDTSRKAAESFVEEVARTGFGTRINGEDLTGANADAIISKNERTNEFM